MATPRSDALIAEPGVKLQEVMRDVRYRPTLAFGAPPFWTVRHSLANPTPTQEITMAKRRLTVPPETIDEFARDEVMRLDRAIRVNREEASYAADSAERAIMMLGSRLERLTSEQAQFVVATQAEAITRRVLRERDEAAETKRRVHLQRAAFATFWAVLGAIVALALVAS